MSTPFYDLASLVVVPSGYKAAKIYAQKPLTTDGQLAFARASTATRVNASGLIESVASGVPRLDYTNSSCPKILLERQRTNLVPYSEQIDNTTYWNSAGGALVITPNVVNSPDGTQNADSITLSNTANRYFVSAPITLTAGSVYTYTVYMKSASGTLNVFMSGVNGLTGQMKSVTTEWQRFTLTFTMHANGSEYFGIDQRAAGSSTSGTLYFWGAQVEAGAYATSYIPTLGASVTRVADAASKTGISSVFGATATTYFMDVIIDKLNPSGGQWTLTAAINSSNFLSLSQFDAATRTPRFAYFIAGAAVWDYTGSALTAGRHKIAAMVKNGSQKFYIDGVLIASNTGSGYTQFSQFALNDAIWASPLQNGQFAYNQVLIFPTELTNAQLAELTAL